MRRKDEFDEWLGAHRTAARAGVAVIVAALVAELLTSCGPLTALRSTCIFATGMLIAGALLYFCLHIPGFDADLEGAARRCATEFALSWRRITGLWALIAVFMCASEFSVALSAREWGSFFVIAAHTCRNVSGLLLVRAYRELTMKSAGYGGAREGARPDQTQIAIAVVVLLIVDVVLRIEDLQTIFHADRDAFSRFYGGFLDRDQLRLRYDAVCWAAFAGVTGMFTARFQSRLIDVRARDLLPVYAGVAVLPLLALADDQVGPTSIAYFCYVLYSGALFLLLAIVHWFVQLRTFFYFSSLEELHHRVRLDREDNALVNLNEKNMSSRAYMAVSLCGEHAHRERMKRTAAAIRRKVHASTDIQVFCPAVHLPTKRDDNSARRDNFFRIRVARVFILLYDEGPTEKAELEGARGSGALIELGAALSHHRPVVVCFSGKLPALVRPPGHELLRFVKLDDDLNATCAELASVIAELIETCDRVAKKPGPLPKATVGVEVSDRPPPPAIIETMPPRPETRVQFRLLLITSANPRGLRGPLDLEREQKHIRQVLSEPSRHRDLIDMDHLPAAQWDDVVGRLGDGTRITALHFSGHGEHRGLVFRGDGDDEHCVEGPTLAKVLANENRHVDLVVLNACFTEQHARELKAVATFIVGTRCEVPDSAASAFSRAFYRTIRNGRSFAAAFSDGVSSASPYLSHQDVYFYEGNGDHIAVSAPQRGTAPRTRIKAVLHEDSGPTYET